MPDDIPFPLVLSSVVDVLKNVLAIIIFVEMFVFLIFIIGELDSLEKKDSSGLHPETFDSVLLLHRSHLVPRYVVIILDFHTATKEFAKE